MKKNYFSFSGLGNELFSKIRFTLILPLIAVMGFSQMQAQEMTTIPGTVVTEPIPIGLKDANSRIAMTQMLPGGMANAILDRPATADIQLVFGPGAQGNQDVMTAFQFAADIWSRELVSNVPIIVMADFANLGAGVLASAGPLSLVQNFPNAPEQDVFYPIALANSLAGEDLVPGTADLVVNLGNGVNFSFETDGNPPPGTFDFVTIALHELGHGLGFIDGGNVNGAGVGDINGGGDPFIFDLFVTDSEGNSVLDLPNPSVELGDFFTSGDVFVNGAFAVDALNGALPEVFAPNPFQGGSSIAHWDEATFPAGDPNSLMSPQVGPGESIFDVGAITRGHFRDMGWVLADQAPVNVIPGSITEILNTGESITVDLTVNNITDGDVNVTVTPSAGAVIIGAINPATFTLAEDGTATVSVELTAANAAGGFFEESLTFSGAGSELTFTVPVSVQVLDGTEAPIITVNPELFDVTLEQGTFTTEDLVIGNVGNADLDFTISIDDGTANLENFTSRVAALNSSIAENGIVTEKVKPSTIDGLAAAITPADGIVSRVIGNLFATDFEDFQLGDLNGQMGWATNILGWDISDLNASSGSQHIRATSDGSAATALAFSPLFELGIGTITSMSTRLNIEGSGVSWEFIPQNTVEGSVVTRVRFNGDGTIDVLDNTNGAAFIPLTGVAVPEGYFTVTINIDSGTLAMDVLFDNEIVFSGFGFATTTNQIVYLSDFAAVGSTFDIDDVDVASIVDENAPFVSVTPSSGTAPFGDDTTLDVLFDARALDPGVFTATIIVESNDPESPTVEIPVTLTVTGPAIIEVDPLELTAAVDLTTDDPATDIQTFTITNNGGTPLDFSVAEGLPVFTPPNGDNSTTTVATLDRSIYGGAAVGTISELRKADTNNARELSFAKISRQGQALASSVQVADSLFLDSGIDFPPAFVGTGPGGPGLSSAVLFTAPAGGFELTAVRNAYQTEGFGPADILIQVYLGGATPDQGELLLEQVFTDDSPTGAFPVVSLDTPLTFSEGETFWIAHTYPTGFDFPQGFDDTVANEPGFYAASTDGGATFFLLDGFTFLTRALNTVEDFISLSPSSGTLNPGEQVEIEATFDATNLEVGLYESDIVVSSNDPVNPEVIVATDFTVSGEVVDPGEPFAVLDPLENFATVNVGESVQRELTLTNEGDAVLSYSFPEFAMGMALADPNAQLQRSEVIDFPNFSPNQPKGFSDTRIGTPVVSVMGTDLEFGYTWLDTDAPGGPINSFFDISMVGTDVTPFLIDGGGFADGTASLALPVPFPFYGEDQETLFINANGFVAFEAPTSGLTFLNGQIPVEDGINNIIAPFWADLEPGTGDGGTVHIAAFAGGIIVQWTDAPGFLTTGSVTFQVILFDDGTILANYEDMETADFLDAATIGIENTGAADGAQVAFNTPFVRDDFAVLFIPPAAVPSFITDVSPLSGDLAPGEQQTITVTLDAAGLDVGVFLDELTVSSNSIDTSASTATFELTVVDQAPPAAEIAFILINADTDVAIGPISDGDVINIGDLPQGTNFNIEAIPDNLDIGSVIFDFNGVANFQTENIAPYALGGDRSGDFRTVTLPLGLNSLTGTTFAGGGGSGEVVASASINFELVNGLGNPEIELLLINASTDESLGLLQDNPVVDLADFPEGTEFTVQAVVSNFNTGSVIFGLNGDADFQTENNLPYLLAGDTGRGEDFLPAPLNLGVNPISATAFSQRIGGGIEGPTVSLPLEIIDSSAGSGDEEDAVVGFVLIDTDTDTSVVTVEEGGTINLAEFSSGLTLAAEIDLENIGSVRFGLNDLANFQIENNAPYSINGDAAGDFQPFNFPLGANVVTIEVFDGRNTSGNLLATATINFTVVNNAVDEIMAIRMSPNPTTDRVELSVIESEGMVVKANLVNFSGQTIYSNIEMDLRFGNTGFIDVSTLPPGVYILVLTDRNGDIVTQEKLVKE